MNVAPAKPSACRRCGREHRTWRELARCRWRNSEYVRGDGAFASVSCCGPTRVYLFPTRAAAEHAKTAIDNTGCRPTCSGDHRLVELHR